MKLIQKELEAMKFEMVDSGMKIQYVPDKAGLAACSEFGREIGRAIGG